jgi:peptide/nickel transport system permease protein
MSTTAVSTSQDPDVTHPPSQPFRRAWRRHKLGVMGGSFVGLIVLAAIFGPILLNIDPNEQSLGSRLLPPFTQGDDLYHVFGTDNLGRDMLARVLIGARASVGVVLAALLLGATLGMLLGILAGFYGGWVDTFIMRLVDAQLSVPTLISAMFVAALLGTGFWNTAITLGVASWPLYARLMRAEALKIRQTDYIEAGVAQGSTDRRLLGSHVLPNLISAMCVVASLELGVMVLIESSLSFIGLGMQPPDASWGSMIRAGQSYIFTAWWLSAVPGFFIMLTVLGLNLMGDWLRDIFDPHLGGR